MLRGFVGGVIVSLLSFSFFLNIFVCVCMCVIRG